MAWVIARLAGGDRPSGAILAALAGAVAVRAGTLYCQRRAGVEAGLRVCAAVRERLLRQLARLGPSGFADQHAAGVASRAVEQVDALDGYFARFLPQSALAVVVPVMMLAVVAALDWLAAVFLLLAAPLIPLFMALVGMGAERLNQAQFRELSRLSGRFLDRVRGLPTITLFDHGERSIEEVAAAAEGYRRRSMRTLRVAFLSSAVLEFFASVAIAVVAIYTGFALLGYIEFGPAQEMTLFSGLFILLLSPEFFQPLRNLAQHYHDRAAAVGAAAEVLGLLERRAPAAHTRDPGMAAGAVAVDGVCVDDQERGRLFGPLSLTVAPGECLVLTGSTGAGKTMLLRLLAGFLEPSVGAVRVGGDGAFAWLGQHPLLVRDSVAGNIRLGRPGEIPEAELQAAADAAGVSAFAAALPDGMDTPVGERGYGLSGGQGRRLALARVFVSEAPLVLLDEPTSGLDGTSREHVVAGIQRLREQGRTLVIASHDQALVPLADRHIALAQGGLHVA